MNISRLRYSYFHPRPTIHNNGVQSLSTWPEFLIPTGETLCTLVGNLSLLMPQGKWLEALVCANRALLEAEAQERIEGQLIEISNCALRRALLLSYRSAILVALSEPGSYLRAVEDAENAVALLRAHSRGPATSILLVRGLLREALARACLKGPGHQVKARALLEEADALVVRVRMEARDEALTNAGATFLSSTTSLNDGSIEDCEELLGDLTAGLGAGKRGAAALLTEAMDLKDRVEGALLQLELEKFDADTHDTNDEVDREAKKESEESHEEKGCSGGGPHFLALEQWLLGASGEGVSVSAEGENGGCAQLSPKSSFKYLVGREYGEGVRGVHLRCDVDAECEVLSVGEEYILTVEKAKLNPLCQRLSLSGIDRELSAAKHCYLAVYILCTRGDPSSHFAPYYKLLPSSFPSMPLFWGQEELGWLRGSYVSEQVEDRRRNILVDYRLIVGAVPELEDLFTLEDFLWARMIVASRNFGITVDGVRTDAMVPYADMLNHLRPRQTRWQYDSARRAFLIITLQPLAAGQQLFDSYGKKCNSRFLLNYGFTVRHNADDDTGQFHNELRLSLSLPPPNLDPWHWHKAERLGGAT